MLHVYRYSIANLKKSPEAHGEIHQTRIVHIISGKDPDFGLQPEVRTPTFHITNTLYWVNT